MVIVFFAVLFAISLLSFFIFSPKCDFIDLLIFSSFSLIIASFLFVPTCAYFGGFVKGYSEGERVGYVTKISEKGLIFKTNEGEMQVGSGQMSALQEPFSFSVKDDVILNKIYNAIENGSKVKLKYNQWLVQPAWEGKSGYEITDITELKE